MYIAKRMYLWFGALKEQFRGEFVAQLFTASPAQSGPAAKSDGPARSRDPLIISFYGGDQYYYDSAMRLRADCKRLGLEHDIRELSGARELDWIDICRKKISFYRQMLMEHDRPVFWIDVDARLLRKPAALSESAADIGVFLRKYKYLPSFDPVLHGRLFVPGFLYLNNTRSTHQFLEFAEELESTSTDRATDDFFVQRALTEWSGQLRFLLFAGNEVCHGPHEPNYDVAWIMDKASGNAVRFRNQAAQHEASILSVARQKRVLEQAALETGRLRRNRDAAAFYRRICDLDPDDVQAYRRFLNELRKTGDEDMLAAHLKVGKQSPTWFRAAWEFELDRELEIGGYAAGQRVAVKMRKLGNDDLNAFAQSRLFRYSLDARAEAIGVADGDRVRLWWTETPYPGNLGDIINPYIVEKLTGVPPKFSLAPQKVLAVGSILRYAKPQTQVWGTGSPISDLRPDCEAIYHAVRGPLTRKLVLDAGGECPALYGDPAWVLPRLFQPRVEKTYKLGLVRHYVHRELPVNLADDVREIEITRCGYDDIEDFIGEICSCEGILSTSLHGVIIANAYGIPARLCTYSRSIRRLRGDGMKFEDYFRSIGRQGIVPLDLSECEVIDSRLVEQCVDNPAVPIDVDGLLESAPFEVRFESTTCAMAASRMASPP